MSEEARKIMGEWKKAKPFSPFYPHKEEHMRCARCGEKKMIYYPLVAQETNPNKPYVSGMWCPCVGERMRSMMAFFQVRRMRQVGRDIDDQLKALRAGRYLKTRERNLDGLNAQINLTKDILNRL